MNFRKHNGNRPRRSATAARRARGQTNLEYAIVLAILLVVSIAGIVVLQKKIADVVGYSIEVTTQDESGSISPNLAIENGTLLPLKETERGLTLDRPTTYQEATGIDNLDDLVEQPE